MKCDELKTYGMNDPEVGDEYEMYKVSEVDAAIAELKAEHHKERHEYIEMVAQLKAKLEDAKATAYAESVDAGMENRRLKRTLWLARARNARNMKAYENLDNYTSNHQSRNSRWNYISSQRYDCWFYAWEKVERKCLKKAEEYK